MALRAQDVLTSVYQKRALAWKTLRNKLECLHQTQIHIDPGKRQIPEKNENNKIAKTSCTYLMTVLFIRNSTK